jgi:hypothetical protein
MAAANWLGAAADDLEASGYAGGCRDPLDRTRGCLVALRRADERCEVAGIMLGSWIDDLARGDWDAAADMA